MLYELIQKLLTAFVPIRVNNFKVAVLAPCVQPTSPLDKVRCKVGGSTEPSRCACDGTGIYAPKAHAMLSNTDVLPCPFFPPTTVNPFAVGSIFTALILLMFSSSNLLILIITFSSKLFLPPPY